ncbi:FAD-dependent oxidoreductase [Streptomyces sp. NBC_00443]|uniref:FAD-dependent oxidoreductase n=1 Tax=Streptomyces sp. NBC_00443 TaxID=2975743 RepID=UPI002E219D24
MCGHGYSSAGRGALCGPPAAGRCDDTPAPSPVLKPCPAASEELPDGTSAELPWRAGKAPASSHVAHSSYRVMPIAMATGQAAGVCAALSVRLSRTPATCPTTSSSAP